MRNNGRNHDELRKVVITRNYLDYAEGSALVEFGKTRVLVAASVTENVPSFLLDSGQGWVTAEYGMLPRCVKQRIPRGKVSGRSYEIQRLIGRSLRAITDLGAFGQRSIFIDCDVIQADGGTRSASITGAYVALCDVFQMMDHQGLLTRWPIRAAVAAISVGLVGGTALLDLDYFEDNQADVDFNVVMTDKGQFVEVQGTAETKPFSRDQLDGMLNLAQQGIKTLFQYQLDALESSASERNTTVW